ncbi:hypothetical protein EVA_18204 [gut metagenome]|uniref:Uncharacterized protein n=1 Tax=gut metagenome TaxID=749906 RepID=J9C1J8_9ZZZZ
MNGANDVVIENLNERMEMLIDEMANTRSARLLQLLNNYPIIPVRAHLRPFRQYWLNIFCGLCFPIGIFFYFRIWMFRIRLAKDMERVIKTDEEVLQVLGSINE